MTAYDPKPIDTAHVVVPADLDALVERLAENTHDVWARDKIDAKGFRYGPVTDDAAKTHKNLVPYAALTEAEKEQDRKVARGVVEALLALGYTVRKA